MIYLVRHAETVANATRVVQLPDAPLSPRGLEQAAALANRLATARVARIRSSDLLRARTTAAAIAAVTGAALEFDPDLAERNYGDVRGTPYAELAEDIFAPDYSPPGGETWEAFHARVDRAWGTALATAAATDGDLVVVTHGLVCRAVAARHLCVDDAPLHWGNTSVTIVDGAPPFAVHRLDCTVHLASLTDGGAV